MRYFILSALLFLFLKQKAQSWQWAKQENVDGESICAGTDPFGNFYHGATINGGVFCSVGSFTFNSYSVNIAPVGTSNSCLIKYDLNGNVLWEKHYPTSGAGSVCSDANGNIYFVGAFAGTLALPGYTLNCLGQTDIFVIKYNNAGNVLWAKNIGGANIEGAYSACCDSFGNLILAGYTTSSVIAVSPNTYVSGGTFDYLLIKYDPQGNFSWYNSSTNATAMGLAVTVDAGNNIYLAGTFGSSLITIGTTTLINAGTSNSRDVFLFKINSVGLVQWALSAKSVSNDGVSSLKTDALGNLFLTGSFTNATFSLNAVTTLTNAGNLDAYLAVYDTNGNVQWGKRFGGSLVEYGYCSAPYNGGVMMAGGFISSTLSVGSVTYTSPSTGDNTFFADYDLAGNLLGSFYINCGGDDIMNIIMDRNKCNMYVFSESGVSPAYIGANSFTHAALAEPLIIAKYNFKPEPTLSIVASGNFCSNTSNTLTALGALTYTWLNGPVSSSLLLPAGQGGIQTVVGSNSLGCTNTASLNVNLNAAPVLTISASPTVVCKDESSKLTVIGANTYTWSTQAQSNTITVLPAVTSIYTVSATGSNSCIASASIQVLVKDCSTGLPQAVEQEEIRLYPNPNKGTLFIDSGTEEFVFTIYNLQGQKVIEQAIRKEGLNIETGCLPGIYYYKIQSKTKLKTGKLIIEQ